MNHLSTTMRMGRIQWDRMVLYCLFTSLLHFGWFILSWEVFSHSFMVSKQNGLRLHKQNTIVCHSLIAYLIFVDAYKPAERHNAIIWGYVADACTIVQIALSLAVICQPMAKDKHAERWFRCADSVILDYVSIP